MTLGSYLERCGGLRREAAYHDCCAFPANWAVACGRPDPMSAWRGAYETEEGAKVLIREAGGLAELFAEGMAAAGIPEVAAPQMGDIGVISILFEEAGAIFTGKRWAFAAEQGFGAASIDPSHVLRIWRP